MNITSPHFTFVGLDINGETNLIWVDVTQPGYTLHRDFITICNSLSNGAKARFCWTLDGFPINGFNPETQESVPETWVTVHRDNPSFYVSDLSNHEDRGPDTAWEWFCSYMSHWNPSLKEWDSDGS